MTAQIDSELSMFPSIEGVSIVENNSNFSGSNRGRGMEPKLPPPLLFEAISLAVHCLILTVRRTVSRSWRFHDEISGVDNYGQETKCWPLPLRLAGLTPLIGEFQRTEISNWIARLTLSFGWIIVTHVSLTNNELQAASFIFVRVRGMIYGTSMMEWLFVKSRFVYCGFTTPDTFV